jgi:hypothetical protein
VSEILSPSSLIIIIIIIIIVIIIMSQIWRTTISDQCSGGRLYGVCDLCNVQCNVETQPCMSIQRTQVAGWACNASTFTPDSALVTKACMQKAQCLLPHHLPALLLRASPQFLPRTAHLQSPARPAKQRASCAAAPGSHAWHTNHTQASAEDPPYDLPYCHRPVGHVMTDIVTS